MLGPLVMLAGLSVIGGWVAAPALGRADYSPISLAGVRFGGGSNGERRSRRSPPTGTYSAVVAVASALISLGLAFLYIRQPANLKRSPSPRGVYTLC
jgi:hypothetical protein